MKYIFYGKKYAKHTSAKHMLIKKTLQIQTNTKKIVQEGYDPVTATLKESSQANQDKRMNVANNQEVNGQTFLSLNHWKFIKAVIAVKLKIIL